MDVSTVVPLRVLGTDVDVHVAGHEAARLAQTVRERWHLALRDDPGGETTHVVRAALRAPGEEPPPWSRTETTVQDTDPARLLQRLTQSITYEVIGARTGDLLMLHAAGLAHPQTGATAVFAAPGNTGKTTLCRTLGGTRAYVSDETVGIRRDGTITPYLKPLSTRRPDWAHVKDEQAPGEVGLTAPVATPWIAGVVLLRRDARLTGGPVVEELDLLDAVLELTPESSGFMGTDGPLRWLAEVLERTGGARRAVYAEVEGLEPLVAEICGRERA
ncbi:hypothetical protein ACI3ET_05685 [Ornithinimicrobium sp. LYQ121]|uniref:hypothetical protein n=1 Tax=Ornithinimicrobium sp. LYQ121 TaxID=3378801 RepID=UPI003852168C